MQYLRIEDNPHITLTYSHDGKRVELDGELQWANLETEQVYDSISSNSYLDFPVASEYSYTLEFVPLGSMRMTLKDDAVKEYTVTRTAEIEASGSTVAALEQARERAGAPKDALIQIDRWSYPEAIQITADDPVKVKFTWEEDNA